MTRAAMILAGSTSVWCVVAVAVCAAWSVTMRGLAR